MNPCRLYIPPSWQGAGTDNGKQITTSNSGQQQEAASKFLTPKCGTDDAILKQDCDG